KFSEKPAVPDTLPGRPDAILASMGIYVFNTRLLESMLAEDAADDSSAHDFGKNILPKAIGNNLQVFAYPFQDVKTRAQSYWRDRARVIVVFRRARGRAHEHSALGRPAARRDRQRLHRSQRHPR